MILEFKLDYRSSSLVYEKIFLKTLKELSLEGKIIKEHFLLKLYVEAGEAEVLEEFATRFSESLPHSLFLHATEASMAKEMPKESYTLPRQKKPSLPFCPKCLSEVMDSEHENYYNIFTECEACGYSMDGEKRSYKNEFEKTANCIKEGKVVELNTFYGKYFVGLPAKVCNDIAFDIIAYDLATIEKYANVEKYEITALGAIEKPLVKLKKKVSFTMDFEEVEADLIRFKIADDLILHLLMEELHKIGIDVLFVANEKIETRESLLLVEPKEELEPIEVVVSENDIAIVSGEKGLPSFPVSAETVTPSVGSFYSVIKEHQLQDENIAGINLSKEHKNNILVYGKKYGLVEYLSFHFEFDSMQDIFERIVATNETGEKIVQNYKKTYPEHFDQILKIVFEDREFNLYKLWGVVAIVLDFAKTDDPVEAAGILEESAMSFLGTRGPRIDYKLLSIDGKVHLDPLMTIRTAMSFKLAGIDELTLCYGVVESFMEFIANELDEVKQSMDITAVAATGSLLGNKHLFSKMSKEIAVNHPIYFNNELPADGRNMFYGGVSLNR
jgi:DNA-directed RNA polymerase subunit M/transcription elongation factor TFIIS